MTDSNVSTHQELEAATTALNTNGSSPTATKQVDLACVCLGDENINSLTFDITHLDLNKDTGSIVIRNMSDYSIVTTIDVDSEQVVITGQTITIHLTAALNIDTHYLIEADTAAIQVQNADSAFTHQNNSSELTQSPDPVSQGSDASQISSPDHQISAQPQGSLLVSSDIVATSSKSTLDLTTPAQPTVTDIPSDHSTNNLPTTANSNTTPLSAALSTESSAVLPSGSTATFNLAPTSTQETSTVPLPISETAAPTPSVVDAISTSNPAAESAAPLLSSPVNVQTPIRGTIRANQIAGTDSDDRIFALAGDDRIEARAGNDGVIAGQGHDRITGGVGNDILAGGTGHDRITGGTGNDVLVGGTGIDTLRGGGGNDQFVIHQLCVGEDTIVDFQITDDVLNLSRLFTDLEIDGQAVIANNTLHDYLKFEQQGQNTVVKIDTDGLGAKDCLFKLATLQNVQAGSLSPNNFVVV